MSLGSIIQEDPRGKMSPVLTPDLSSSSIIYRFDLLSFIVSSERNDDSKG